MTALRIFSTSRPSDIGARVVPMDMAEQAVLDELPRRREAKRMFSPAASQPAPADGITSPARIEAAAGDIGDRP